MIALYSRVSTADQMENGYSLEEQEERLASYCKSRGWTDYKHFTDGGFSGGNTDRPALQEMIRLIKQGKINRVIVYKLDRLSRSQKDTLELIEDLFIPHHVDFISMSENLDTSSAFGMAMVGMLSCFAQLEKQTITERMTIGREARAKEGKWHGGSSAPIGYDYVDGQLVINGFESMQIREIFSLFLKGHTFTEIASSFNAKGWTHKYGNWQLQRVRMCLKNPVYIGMVRFNGQTCEGIHQPIIDKETFDKAADLLSNCPKTRTFKRRPINESYFVGKLYCGQCGGRYTHTISYSGRNNSKKLHYYSCSNRMHTKQTGRVRCTNKIHRCDAFDSVIFDEMRSLTIEEIKIYRKRNSVANLETFQKEIAKLEKQRSRLIDLYSLGTFDAEELTSKIEPLTKSINSLEEQIASTGKRTMKEMETVIKSISDVLDRDDAVRIRQLIDILIDRIEIDGEDLTIYWNFD